jgi:hypothetical protein
MFAQPKVGQARERMRRIGVLMGYAENDQEGQANFAAFQGDSRSSVDGGPQHPDRRSLGGDRRGFDATIREGTRHATA